MTVGIYLQTPFPTIISDCLVTKRNLEEREFSPSDIEEAPNGDAERTSILCSKLMFLDNKTVLSFAGSSENIMEFMKNFPEIWASRPSHLRPMEYLRDVDYSLSETRPGWNCSILGASVLGDLEGGCQVNNYASLNDSWKFDTKNFGTCFSIGSGAQYLENRIREVDRRTGIRDQDQSDLAGYAIIVGALNSEKLFQKSDEKYFASWGGYLQDAMYFSHLGRWVRSGPWYHLAVAFSDSSLKQATPHPKVVFHAPHPSNRNQSDLFAYYGFGEQRRKYHWKITRPDLDWDEPSMKIYDTLDGILVTVTEIIDGDKPIFWPITLPLRQWHPALSCARKSFSELDFSVRHKELATTMRAILQEMEEFRNIVGS